MTESIADTARRNVSPGTQIVPLTAPFGAEAIDCAFESLLSAVAVMDAVTTFTEPYDAIVMAGFGEHGRDGVQELTTVPVIDIAEASAAVAQFLGRSYSVITTLDRSVGAIEDRLLLAGLSRRCASVRSTGLSTAQVEAYPDAAVVALLEQARQAVAVDQAEVICLGCGGMAGLDTHIRAELDVPVIDGVVAGVRLAEALVNMGLSTSKVGSYADPPSNPLTFWPVSAHLKRESGERP